MHNATRQALGNAQPLTIAGCDVGKDQLDVVRRTADHLEAHRRFANTAAA